MADIARYEDVILEPVDVRTIRRLLRGWQMKLVPGKWESKLVLISDSGREYGISLGVFLRLADAQMIGIYRHGEYGPTAKARLYIEYIDYGY